VRVRDEAEGRRRKEEEGSADRSRREIVVNGGNCMEVRARRRLIEVAVTV
jgi:hypothetical protein